MAQRLVICLFMLLMSQSAMAAMFLDPRNANETVIWSGGDLTRTFDFCASSVLEPRPNGTTVIPYAITAEVNGAAPFTLESGAGSIPVSLSWQDLVLSNSENLAPAVTTAEEFTGALRGCPGGNNGRLVLTIAEADIAAAAPDTYTQTFDITASNSGGGRNNPTASVTFDLTVPDSIQLTQVNDINLGVFDGINDMTGSDSLCVYRRGGGQYGVTITGSGNGGAFTLSNGASTLPYSVTWDDGGGAQAVTSGVLLSGLANTYTAGPDCSGGALNNAILGVQVLATDIAAAATGVGTHTGTLTITVEMQ